MSLIRLKRQDFHTCVCSIIIILINSCISFRVNESVALTVLFAVLYMTFGGMTGAFDFEIRKSDDLIKRHITASAITVMLAAVLFPIFWSQFLLFLYCNICYGIWLILAKRWLRHEICPGWTILLYDSLENLEKAKAIVESRKDLMVDAYHYLYNSEEDMEHIVQIFRIPQMVICLETGTEKAIAYCKEAGITAFIKGENACKGQKIDKEGLLYIRPVPAAWKCVLGRIKRSNS